MRSNPWQSFVPRQRLTPVTALAQLVARFGLPAWFVLWTVADCRHRLGEFFGSDTRIYARGAAAFLDGRDPWSAAVGPFHFAGLPPTVQLYVPFALIPEDVAVAIGFVVAGLAAIAIVRTLGLPWWWLLFPPLAHGVVVANPHVLLTALLLTNRGWAEALAGLFKIYAIVPLAGRFRWRALVLTAVGLAVSFALAPQLWLSYVSTMAETTIRLTEESAGGFSAAIVPTLLLPMGAIVMALAVIDRHAASWLAVSALWPATQFFTQTLLMPLFAPVARIGAEAGHAVASTRAVAPAWFAALLAIPSRGVVPIAIALYVVFRLLERRRDERAARSVAPSPPELPASAVA